MINYSKYGVTREQVTGHLSTRNTVRETRDRIIKDLDIPNKEIAKEFGLSVNTIQKIKRGEYGWWKSACIDGRRVDRFVLNCF